MADRDRLAIASAIAVGLLAVAGCKPHPGSRAPRRDVSGMDPDAIDRELAANLEDLRAAGIDVPLPPSEAPVAADSPATPETPGPGATPDEDDADVPEPQTEAEPTMAAPREPERLDKRRRGSRASRSRSVEPDRCARICDLAEVTCDLQAQICSLAERHPHEIRYEDACVRAELQCDAATRECDLCSGQSPD